MALVILAHPSPSESIANQSIIETLQQSDLAIEVRDIGKRYPVRKLMCLRNKKHYSGIML